MPHTKTFHLILLTLSGVLISFVKTAWFRRRQVAKLKQNDGKGRASVVVRLDGYYRQTSCKQVLFNKFSLCRPRTENCTTVFPCASEEEYSQEPIPTLWNDSPELPSGGGALETTPPARFSDSTGFPSYTSDYELEDTTHLHHLNNDNESLGPGAIGAIVIAALLGTSVIVALIVITLRKCSAS